MGSTLTFFTENLTRNLAYFFSYPLTGGLTRGYVDTPPSLREAQVGRGKGGAELRLLRGDAQPRPALVKTNTRRWTPVSGWLTAALPEGS